MISSKKGRLADESAIIFDQRNEASSKICILDQNFAGPVST